MTKANHKRTRQRVVKQPDAKTPTSLQHRPTENTAHLGLYAEQPEHSTLIGSKKQEGHADFLRQTPQQQRPNAVLQMQRRHGNAHTARVIKQMQTVPRSEHIQREGPPGGTATQELKWEEVLDIPTAYTYEEAIENLEYMEWDLEDLSYEYESIGSTEEIDNFAAALAKLRLRTIKSAKKGAFESQGDLGEFVWAGMLYKSLYESKISDIKKAFQEAFENIKTWIELLDVQEADLAEKLHYAFIEGSDEDTISALKKGVEAITSYKDNADKFVDWGKKIAEQVKATKVTEYLTKFAEASKTIGKGLDYAGKALDAAKIVKTLLTERGTSADSDAIDKFEATIDAIDIGMSFTKAVPLLGTLWSKYYYPMTKACIKNLRIIARYMEKNKRDWALYKFMTAPKDRSAVGAPKIPNEVMDAFPGGQAMMDFMWQVMKGQTPIISSSVEEFFYDHSDQFNIGLEDKDELETEWHLFEKNEVKGLHKWLSKHKNTVWKMLYGSLDPNI